MISTVMSCKERIWNVNILNVHVKAKSFKCRWRTECSMTMQIKFRLHHKNSYMNPKSLVYK
jgi:hypothetical protein